MNKSLSEDLMGSRSGCSVTKQGSCQVAKSEINQTSPARRTSRSPKSGKKSDTWYRVVAQLTWGVHFTHPDRRRVNMMVDNEQARFQHKD